MRTYTLFRLLFYTQNAHSFYVTSLLCAHKAHLFHAVCIPCAQMRTYALFRLLFCAQNAHECFIYFT